MTATNCRFSQYNEDSYRLPEGIRRIAYDADTQRYTFRDRSGQLYTSASGEEYGVLKPVSGPLPHRRNVTITGTCPFRSPFINVFVWSLKPAKTFNDILPSGYITAAKSGVESPTSEKIAQAAIPVVQDVVEIVRRRTTLKRRPAGAGGVFVSRSDSLRDEKRRLLEDDSAREVVRKEDVDGRLARSKSEMRPSRFYSRK
ncbi:hypothetical protein JVU11DRAFT_1184 [Chiua virens]|nr:hypothetical protein JVU11DRAFT_1184 [Chiua virens]